MKKTTIIMRLLMMTMVLLLLLTGCTGTKNTASADNFASVRQNGLASVGDVIYAMLEGQGKTELHAFDRAAGTRNVVELEAIEKEGELFISLDPNNRYLKSDGTALYSAGDSGSGGYYRTDPEKKTYERIGFYQEAAMNGWTYIGDTAYLAMQDAQGYGLYAVEPEEMEVFGALPEPLLRRKGSGRFDVIHADGAQLLLFEKKPEKQWYDLIRYDPETGEETLLAENVNTDYAPRIGETYMICRYAGEEEGYELYRTEVVLMDENGEQTAKIMDVDGLWRATAAGGRFVLDRMYAEHIRGEHVVYVIDPKNPEELQAAMLGEGYNVIIGGDERHAYFWSDAQNVSSASALMALDVETMEVVSPFA